MLAALHYAAAGITFRFLQFSVKVICSLGIKEINLQMFILRKSVLLLKAPNEDGPDKYEKILVENGFDVKYLQILDFKYINLEILQEKLKNHDLYNGIIFTSPRGVIATKLITNNNINNWVNKNNYVVGESTFDLCKNELNLICKGKETGNANNLADLIISENNINKNYLFPCGNLKKETLGKKLTEHDIKIDSITIYETFEKQNLSEEFNILTDNLKNISEYIVFFSPSGVNFLNNLIKNIKLPFENLKLIAIGPSTEEKLISENLPVFSVAKKPTETALLNAILNIK